MKITVLVENKAIGAGVKRAHGLSLYIETKDHTILFDFGPRGDLLFENAAALDVDLDAVDVAVLSHGHDDHSGGLEAFLQANDHAKVYIHPRAFLPHFANNGKGYVSISADGALAERCGDRIVWTDGVYDIDDTLTLFSDIKQEMPLFATNRTLFEQLDGDYVPDDFLHEQDLLVREDGRTVLIGGCAHRGITNILRRAEALEGRTPDAVFSGFHLTNPGIKVDEPEDVVRCVGAALKDRPLCRYYTGHCTGEGPYEILLSSMGTQVAYMGCGTRFEV